MAAVVALVRVLGVAWWMSQSFADQAHCRVRDDLERLHQSTAQAVVDWMSSLDRTARAAANSPAVRDVIGTGASDRARPWPSAWTGRDLSAFRSSGTEHDNAGYCIMDARSRVVASDDVLLLHQDLGRMLGRDRSPSSGDRPSPRR